MNRPGQPSAAAWHEVAAWIRRWQPDRQVVADVARQQIVVAGEAGAVFYEADAVRRLVPARNGAPS